MLRNSILLAGLLLFSANVFADASALLGKWKSACTQYNQQGTEFADGVTEVKADGTAISTHTIYADNKCAGSVISTPPAPPATYTATDTVMTVKFLSNGYNVEVLLDYVVSGNTLTLTIKKVLVDGVDQKVGPETVVLTKVP